MEVLRGAGIEFQPGEEALRETRLAALFRSNLTLRHFPIDLLRSTPGWEAAFAQSISDLEGAGLRPEDVVADSAQLEDVLTIWRALDQSAQGSWTTQRIYLEAAIVLEQRSGALAFCRLRACVWRQRSECCRGAVYKRDSACDVRLVGCPASA